MKMIRFFCKIIISAFGFTVDYRTPKEAKKCVMVFAPHTSMWDFVIGKLVLTVMGVSPKFMIRKESFWFPMGILLRALGGIPVDRKHPVHVPAAMADEIKQRRKISLVIAPEGTRKYTNNWKKGFYFIAQQAEVPICVCYIDWGTKTVGVSLDIIIHSPNDYDSDLAFIQNYYRGMRGKHSGQFNLEFEQ